MLKRAFRPISAVVLAALVAGTVTIISGASDTVVASAPLNSGKGDRLDSRPLGTRCSQQAWPYFEADCLRDTRKAMGQAQSVRIVTADRLVPGR
jgi:hypothetical protein